MKVKELLHKVNGNTASLPIYIEDIGKSHTARKAESFDFNGYYYEEAYKTVAQIEILKDKIVVFYK